MSSPCYRATSVKYQCLINVMKANYAAKEKVKAVERNMIECCANVSFLKSIVEGTSMVEDELRDAEADLKGLETTFTNSLDVVPQLNHSDVTFTPYSELGGSDIEKAIPEGVDEFGSNVGFVIRTFLDARTSPAGAETGRASSDFEPTSPCFPNHETSHRILLLFLFLFY